MYTKQLDGMYLCNECYHELKTEQGIRNHIKNKHETSNKLKAAMAKEIEEIRTTSTSIHEVVDRLTNMWLANGIKITFSNYPSDFNLSVSNSHESPAGYPTNWGGDGDKPRGYPGWRGSWNGTVEIIDHKRWPKSMYFSDVINDTWGEYKTAPVTWLKTGSGGGGESFRYSGSFFVYDFPKMHEEFKRNNNEYKVLENEYTDAIDMYNRKFRQERDLHVRKASTCVKVGYMKDQVEGLLATINTAQEKVKEHAYSEFTAAYDVKVPKPTSIFVKDAETKQAILSKNVPTQVLPYLAPIYERIEDLTTKIETYMADNPEVFI